MKKKRENEKLNPPFNSVSISTTVGTKNKRKRKLTVEFAEGGVEFVEIEVRVVIDVVVGQHVRQGAFLGQLGEVFVFESLHTNREGMRRV